MSIKERIKGTKKRTIITVIVVMVVLVSVPLWVLLQPERPSPAILKERGIEWHVFIEEPISIDEVESIIVVFSNQVDVLFGMETHSTVYEHMKDDGIRAYSSSDSYPKVYPAPNSGPIKIPVYFLTGNGSESELGWASRNPQYFKNLVQLEFRIVIPNSSDAPRYVTKGLERLIVLLHEFGHLMGLKDLYPGGDVEGCSELRVIMNNLIMGLNSTFDPSPPFLKTFVANRTTSMYPIGNGTEPEILQLVEEVYLDHNSVWFVNYDIITRKGGETYLTEPRAYEYDLNQLKTLWTIEEAKFIGMDGTFDCSCRQEFG